MSIKTYRPTTPARRQMTVSGFDGVEKHVKPEKSLVEVLKKNSGRNSYGRITVRHQGGGNRQKYRVIDFKRDKTEMTAKVLRLEYDPNRSAFIALCEYEDGERRYILAPVGLSVGDTIVSSAARRYQAGQRSAHGKYPCRYRYPQHRAVPRQGRSACPLRRRRRSADGQGKRHGTPSASPPARYRKVRLDCMATIGQVGNIDHANVQHRQGRPQTPHGHPSHRPRLRHEPL